MKKHLRLFSLLLAACLLGGCVHIDLPDPEPQTVYASFWPVYALSEGICRGVPNLSLHCLTQPQDGCLCSYSLSSWDAAMLSGADLLILGGRGLESFAGAFSGGALPVLTAMENMPLRSFSDEPADEEDHFSGENPWYFLSVEGARSICSVIAGGMAQLDPDFSALYAQNLEAMLARFDELQAQLAALRAQIEPEGVILMQEGLGYFAEEMGLAEHVFIRREAGADMSRSEFDEALQQMRQSGYRLVLIERQAPQGLVEEIEAAGYTVCLIDILTDHSAAEGAEAYFAAMLQNAQALARALQ